MKKLLSICVLLAGYWMFAASARAQVVVIANPSVASSSVSKEELRKVFIEGASRLKDGSKVTPVLLKQGPAHSAFLLHYLETTDVRLMVVWRGLVLTGQGTVPKSFDSEAEMVQYVASKPGALGYISNSTAHDGVKVLAVQ
jgi:hypothetical protein